MSALRIHPISTKFYYDARLRNAAVQVYASLYGRLTPKCVPGVSTLVMFYHLDHHQPVV